MFDIHIPSTCVRSRRMSLARRTTPPLLGLTAWVMMCIAPMVIADPQSGDAAAASNASTDAMGLVDVVVTAQRRTEDLQKVPIAITALNSDELAARRIENTADLAAYVPNTVAFTSSGQQQGAVAYYLRGIGNTESIATFDPPIGTYVDDIYIARQALNNFPFFGVDQVEVLRGPQGTLFGRNTTGGAINIITTKPNDEFSADLIGEYGERDHLEARGNVNIPVMDRLFVRLSAFGQREDGYYTSAVTHTKVGESNDSGVRLQMRALLGDQLDWYIAADYVVEQGLSVSVPSLATVPATAGRAATVFNSYQQINTLYPECYTGSNAFQWLANHCQGAIADENSLTSNLKWSVSDGLTVNFITGYRATGQNFTGDFQGNNPTQAFQNFFLTNDGQFRQVSQEIKAAGSAFANRLSYVAGLFYFHERDRTHYAEEFGIPVIVAGVFPATDSFLINTTSSYAAYAQADTKLLDNLTLTTGGRITHDQKNVEINFDALSPISGGFNYNTSNIATPSIETTKFNPKVALEYQVTPTLMTYASATNGFKSGGWNARSATPQGFAPFYDEKVWSYELGARTQFLDNRLRVNVTAFLANYTDLQISAVIPNVIPRTFATQNAGNSRDKGFELEANAVLTKGLTSFLSVGAQNAKFVHIDPSAAQAGYTLSSRVSYAPPATVNAGFAYDHLFTPIGGRFIWSAAVQYVPSYDQTVIATAPRKISEYHPVTATLGYVTADDRFKVEALCRNCLNQPYIQIAAGNANSLGILPYWGVRVTTKIK